MDKNLKVVEKERRYVASGQSKKYFPLVVSKAEDSKIWDLDENEFIDFLSSAAVFNVGHNNSAVIEAMKRQMKSFLNYTNVYLYTQPSVDLAEKLTKITPGTFTKKVAFGFSGGDAVDTAIKVSRAFTGKKHIVIYDESYHGTTYGALSTTMVTDVRSREAVFPMKDVKSIPYPNPYRNFWGIDGYERPDDLLSEALNSLNTCISSLKGDISAIMMEPIQGDAGIIIPPNGYIKEVRRICDEHGLIFIDEEVQTGMGRTGRFWAIEHFSAVPDILISAKALGAGMPISAVVGRKKIMESVKSPLLVFTNAGHALSSSAALAAISVVENESLVERANEIGNYVMKRLYELEKYDQVGDIRGKGLLIGVEIVNSKKAKKPDRVLAQKTIWRAWEKGLILATLGKSGNVLRIAPPLNIPKETLDRGLDIIEESLKDALDGKVSNEITRYIKGW
ncbi:MAG: aspartate aminotransferase family protein [Thermoplasmatales archaeon]